MNVYHYTSVEGLQAILSCGFIEQSTLSGVDAFHGPGVYLTTMGPEYGRAAIAMNNWGRGGLHMEIIGKVDRAIRLIIPQQHLRKAGAGGRDVWVHPGRVHLNRYLYEIHMLH